MSDRVQEAKQLQEQGKSLQEIATELGVSKTTAHRMVHKSMSNPRWIPVNASQGGGGYVDAYQAIPTPSFEQLFALNQDTVYMCVKWISDTISSIPLKVYVKTNQHQPEPKCATRQVRQKSVEHHDEMDLREVIDHPLKDLLEEPNRQMSKTDYLRLVDQHLELTGNHFSEKLREEEDDLPSELIPLTPQSVDLAYDDYGRQVGFWLRSGNFNKRFIARKNMLWIKLVDPANPFGIGLGPTQAAYQRILLSMAELGYLSALYRNQSRPDLIVQIKDALPAQCERLQKELDARFSKGGAAGSWVIDSEEVDVKKLSWSPRDVLSTDLYKWNKTQIVNQFSLNDAIFQTESSNRATADTANYQAMKNAVAPRVRLIEEAINMQVSREFDDRLLALFDNPVPEDESANHQQRLDLLNHGVLTPDEVRQEIGK